MKIFGIGLNKTGTKTLGACFKKWGLQHLSTSVDAFEFWTKKDILKIATIVDKYDSFEDWPWPLVYRNMDLQFPGSKFILTRRLSSDIWFSSLCKHAHRTGPTFFREQIYGHAMPHNHKEHHIKIYENHLTAVRGYFENRLNNFLEVCWEEGDQWEKLSKFLGFPIPNDQFPHENKSLKKDIKLKIFI